MKKTLLSIFLAVSAIGTAQITTSNQYTVEELINDVLIGGTSITANNVNSSSAINFTSVNSLGYFTKNGSNFPFNDGIILTTGSILNAPGPNTTMQSGGSWPGDADLQQFYPSASLPYQNATSLEFDFVASTGEFNLNYIFASEEYGLFQCTYGDAFAIILTDMTTSTQMNIAVVPGTVIPVSVGSVRNSQYNSNCASVNAMYFGAYYAPTDMTAPVNFNGVTIPMTASASIITGHLYNLKIVIGDYADSAYDSALFIEGGSFGTSTQDIQLSASNGYTLCNGESTVLSVTAPASATYSWSTGSTGNNYVATEAGIYSVSVSVDGTVNTYTFNILDNDAIIINGGNICVDYITGEVQPYIINTGLNASNYTFVWSYNGLPIPGATGDSFTAFEPGVYSVVATDVISGCAINNEIVIEQSGPASPIGTGYTIDGQNVTVNVEGYGDYEFQLDGFDFQENNTFENLSYGVFTVTVADINGCGNLQITFEITMPDAPNGQTDQTFIPGETLADLEVEGENIQWYDNPGDTAGRDANDNDDIALPMSTPLQDNTTYYATQTIYGIESMERFPVTAHAALDVSEATFTSLTYYPNPVKDILTLSNNTIIDEVVIYNLLGQVVFSKTINEGAASLNLSAISEGIYTVKLTSSGVENKFKIIKE